MPAYAQAAMHDTAWSLRLVQQNHSSDDDTP